MILYCGVEKESAQLTRLSEKFILQPFHSIEDALASPVMKDAEAFLLGPEILNPVKEIQKIFIADKHLAVVILVLPVHLKQVKQTIQFSAFIGNNTLVIPMNPELDLTVICDNAVSRTRQKRNFHHLNVASKNIGDKGSKTKLSQMGSFLEYAPVAAILLNEANRIVNFNRQARHYIPKLEFLDVELRSVLPLSQSQQISKFINSAHTPEETEEIQLNHRAFQLTVTEVYDDEGSKHFLLLLNDITEQQQQVKRVQAILESIPQMAWTTDIDGKVNYFTQSWYFYTGQTLDEAVGYGWMAVIYPEDQEKLIRLWSASVKTGKPFQGAARYRNINGDYRWHLARASAIRDQSGDINMWVGTCTDIHDQMLLTEELERKVKERTKKLESTNIELEQFAHVSSHDLQEPLRKIRTFAELLKEGIYGSIDDASKRYIDKISTTAERMSNSLRSLLNYTRLKKEERFVTVSLNEIVSQVLIDLELMISQKNATVEIKPLPAISASAIQMQQLFYNLINNALKFSLPGVAPCIEISARQVMEEELVLFPQLQHFRQYHEITVKDNGIGFDEKHGDRIFEIFQRLHAKAGYEGTGIGLSAVKKVVQNHEGEIIVHSEVNKGTIFHIILPE